MPIDPALVPLLDMINTLPHMNPPFDAAAFRLADEQPMPAFRARPRAAVPSGAGRNAAAAFLHARRRLGVRNHRDP